MSKWVSQGVGEWKKKWSNVNDMNDIYYYSFCGYCYHEWYYYYDRLNGHILNSNGIRLGCRCIMQSNGRNIIPSQSVFDFSWFSLHETMPISIQCSFSESHISSRSSNISGSNNTSKRSSLNNSSSGGQGKAPVKTIVLGSELKPGNQSENNAQKHTWKQLWKRCEKYVKKLWKSLWEFCEKSVKILWKKTGGCEQQKM